MSKSKWFLLGILFSLAIVTFGCGGGSSGNGGGSGTFSLSMTDAAADYAAVFITINEVQIHLGGNEANPGSWRPLTMQRHPITVNLMDLTNGVREQLGLVDLPEGDYTQVRLIIGETAENNTYPHANYVVDQNVPPNIYELKVPSGTNTGFKIVENFTIADQQTLELILDFDASKSVIEAREQRAMAFKAYGQNPALGGCLHCKRSSNRASKKLFAIALEHGGKA